MQSKMALSLLCYLCNMVAASAIAQQAPAGQQSDTKATAQAPGAPVPVSVKVIGATPVNTKKTAQPGPGGPGGPGRGGPVFGTVAAVRGNVLQMSTPGGKGLTRVILGADAQIIRDDKLKTDVLKPGMKVTAIGRQIDGTGVDAVPLKVEVQSLEVAGGMGGPFAFFGGGGSPLMRGAHASIFRKVNYSGNIECDAQVKSVNPLILTDEEGNALPVVLAENVEVHSRAPRRIKDGDITAGARLLAMGAPTPDGLIQARMIVMMGQGSEYGSMPGTIMGMSAKGVTLRPRFQPRDLLIELTPKAKVYNLEPLDLDSVHVGDTLLFTGKVIGGTAKAPTALVVNTITPANEEVPHIAEDQGNPFGGNTVTATIKGAITGFDPLKVQTDDGREVTITVPGQISYVHYRLLNRSAMKTGQKALFSGKNKEGGLIADVVILNPAHGMGPSF